MVRRLTGFLWRRKQLRRDAELRRIEADLGARHERDAKYQYTGHPGVPPTGVSPSGFDGGVGGSF